MFGSIYFWSRKVINTEDSVSANVTQQDQRREKSKTNTDIIFVSTTRPQIMKAKQSAFNGTEGRLKTKLASLKTGQISWRPVEGRCILSHSHSTFTSWLLDPFTDHQRTVSGQSTNCFVGPIEGRCVLFWSYSTFTNWRQGTSAHQ